MTATESVGARPNGDSHSAEPLVDAAWLASRLGTQGLVLLHVDGDSTSYYGAHVPGALPVDSHDELLEHVRRGPVSSTHFEELMRRKGITTDSHIVLYGTGGGTFAAHAYWLLRYSGHDRISLLDGGLEAWVAAGGRVEDTEPVVTPVGPYSSSGPDPTIRVRREAMLEHYIHAPGEVVVLDCRDPDEYAGLHHHPLDLGVEHHRVGGHVPGARNLPSQHLLDDDGRFRPLAELATMFAKRGIDERSDVVVYCRVAERSALLWFALHELLGHPRVRHYDGGWAEYGSLLDVPVERGR